MKTETNTYTTTDIALGAYLVSIGYRIVSIDKTDPGRSEFYFARAEGLDKYVETFWSNKAQVNPLDYFNSIKYLKSRIYA